MILAPAFTLLAAALAGAAPAGQSRAQDQLGVTATVIRPAELTVIASPLGGPVALIHNSASIAVVTDGGSIRHLDGDTIAVSRDASGPVTITLIF